MITAHPQQHALIPTGYIARRTNFLRSTIPQPTPEDRAHDTAVAALLAAVTAEQRTARSTARTAPPELHGDPVAAFLAEHCDRDPDATILKARLFTTWRAWAVHHGHPPGSPASFTTKLRAAAPDITSPPRRHAEGGRYRGLRLADEVAAAA